MSQDLRFQAFKQAWQKASSAPIIHDALAVFLVIVKMSADYENTFVTALQRTNQVLLFTTFNRLLAKAFAAASCFSKHFFEIRFSLVVVTSKLMKPVLNGFSTHLNKTDGRLLCNKT